MAYFIQNIALLVIFAPLIGALITGLFCKRLNTKWIALIGCTGIFIAFASSIILFKLIILDGVPKLNTALYTWWAGDGVHFDIGIFIDRLSVLMMLAVTFIGTVVNVYSVRYMRNDEGFGRYFSYLSFFIFFMLVLVTANNFLSMFFGWEGISLSSYLLIGFWFYKESASKAGFKAFLVNRIGDAGFILGIAAVFYYFGSLNYLDVFTHIAKLNSEAAFLICLLLFSGAVAKSAQLPLHFWLPDSMEGPTPISALIHSATMVAAGVYIIIRLSPLFALNSAVQSVILLVGVTTALFIGLLALVEFDIKKIIAYSTISQLGYMMAALGVAAFTPSMSHLINHACYKTLLFLAAGSVILAMGGERDVRKMGGVKKYMPITYAAFLVGSLSMCGIPPFSGFYSKQAIIDAVRDANIFGHHYGYLCLSLGVFVTACYTFRAVFLVFFTPSRLSKEVKQFLRESPLIIWLPLVILTISAIVLGFFFHDHTLFTKRPIHDFSFWLALAGLVTAGWFYLKNTKFPEVLAKRFSWIYKILISKYWIDAISELIIVRCILILCRVIYQWIDVKFIDDFCVNGIGWLTAKIALGLRRIQSGYIYFYALIFLISITGLLCFFICQ